MNSVTSQKASSASGTTISSVSSSSTPSSGTSSGKGAKNKGKKFSNYKRSGNKSPKCIFCGAAHKSNLCGGSHFSTRTLVCHDQI